MFYGQNKSSLFAESRGFESRILTFDSALKFNFDMSLALILEQRLTVI